MEQPPARDDLAAANAATPGQALDGGSTPLHLKNIKRRFLALNNERVLRVREALKPEQRVFVDVLPLLFHINHPSLPGYSTKKAPIGVADYTVPSRTIDAAGRLVKKFNYKRRAMRVYSIHGLYLIGSSGTIAYSEKSDLDIWVCHEPGMPEAQVEALREKCDAISAWAKTLKLDTTFFVMDPDSFRRGETEALSVESSGSAQHHLLLEEFYRTGLLLAGRYPGWWLIPPDREVEGRDYIANLINRGHLHEHEFIDFGEVHPIPAGEFFGAALWQLHKAVDSPYKSVLKLLLMEAYAGEYPGTDLLCTRFKRAVYTGETNIDRLDPYVLMEAKVDEYLLARGELDRLELARKCFYFKVGERMSERAPRFPEPRREMMAELVQRWHWSADQLLVLDSRATWKIHRVLEERRMLVDELSASYRIVSEFARRHARSSSINSTDLNLLGRRLYTAFERKAGKVDIVNPGISTDLTEERLNFVHTAEGGVDGWLLFRSDYEPSGPRRSTPLKRAQSLIELVAWCHFNRLIGPQTLVSLHNSASKLDSRELLAIIDSVRRLFPDGRLPATDMESLRQPARIVSGALYINLGLDPLSHHTRQGVHLTSNRSDALSYGGIWKNLALTFDLLLVSSWGEVLTLHYHGDSALADCLCDYLAWMPLSGNDAPPPLPVYSFSTARGMAIAHRVEELLRDAIQAFYHQSHGPTTRYVLRIEHDFHLLVPENDVPRHQRIGSEAELVAELGRAQDAFSPIVFDRYAVEGSLIARLVEQNRPDVVQVFMRTHNGNMEVYVLDERGSLFFQLTEHHSSAALINQYQRFLESAIRRCNATEHAPDATNVSDQVEFFVLRRDRHSQVYVERLKDSALPRSSKQDYLSIQVIGSPNDADQGVFSLFCEGREFSSLEYGDDVFTEVARHVLSYRGAEQRYPIYITDADVGRSLLGADGALTVQTVHFLRFKRAIERRLNEALGDL